MFSYTTALAANEKVFNSTCEKIEKNVKGIKKGEFFTDILDGDLKQEFYINSKKITVYNDCEVDAVYVDSEIDLGGFISSVV